MVLEWSVRRMSDGHSGGARGRVRQNALALAPLHCLSHTTCARMQIYAVLLAAIPSVLETAKQVNTHISDAVALLLEFDQLFRLHNRHLGRASLVLID